MQTFTDSKSREWSMLFTHAAHTRIRAAGIDLYDDEVLSTLAADLPQQADIAWLLVKPQATELGVSETDFFESLTGDCFRKACDAVLAELLDFFRLAAMTTKTAIVTKATATRDAILSVYLTGVESISVEKIAAEAEAKLAATLSEKSSTV